MLLDSFDAIPEESSQLISPVIPSTSGCLELSFHYYLFGTSTTMEISVHAITGKMIDSSNVTMITFPYLLGLFPIYLFFLAGGSLGNPLFTVTGNQGKGWKPAEVRLEGTGNIQVNSWK